MNRVSSRHPGVVLMKRDADTSQGVFQKLAIHSIPTTVLLSPKGEPLESWGIRNESEVEAILQSYGF